MGAAYSELGPLGRDLAIWEIHLKSSGKSPHTVKSYIQGVRALAGFLTDQGLPLDPERITTTSYARSRRTCYFPSTRAARANAPARSAPATIR